MVGKSKGNWEGILVDTDTDFFVNNEQYQDVFANTLAKRISKGK